MTTNATTPTHSHPVNSDKPKLYGAIEAGGTKIVCAIGHTPLNPINVEHYPTGSPTETIARIVEYFKDAQQTHGQMDALAIGCFGSIDIHPRSADFGKILKTPKPNWEGTNIYQAIRKELGEDIQYALDTDVNAAALGEYTFGAGRGSESIAYVTVGTGIGASHLVNGHPVNGRLHCEVGHTFVPNLEPDSSYQNTCVFHNNCLEGWASGPAIEKRWNQPAKLLPPEHPAWDLEAAYLAHCIVNITAMWAPDTVIFGGGVMQQEHLLDKVRNVFKSLAKDYWSLPILEHYIQKAELDQLAGIIGGLQLAQHTAYELKSGAS